MQSEDRHFGGEPKAVGMQRYEPHQHLLEKLLGELSGRRLRIGAALDVARMADGVAGNGADREMALEGEGRLLDQEIASVRRALDRIADGTYGRCVECRSAIKAARLKARPEAALCIRCARQHG